MHLADLCLASGEGSKLCRSTALAKTAYQDLAVALSALAVTIRTPTADTPQSLLSLHRRVEALEAKVALLILTAFLSLIDAYYAILEIQMTRSFFMSVDRSASIS